MSLVLYIEVLMILYHIESILLSWQQMRVQSEIMCILVLAWHEDYNDTLISIVAHRVAEIWLYSQQQQELHGCCNCILYKYCNFRCMQPKLPGKRPNFTVVTNNPVDLKVSMVNIHQKIEKLCVFEVGGTSHKLGLVLVVVQDTSVLVIL